VKLAYFTVPGRGETDAFVVEIAKAFEAQGLRIAGTVRERPVETGAHPCDMTLRVLPAGPVFRISQPLGTASRGCRLDGGAIESISAQVEKRLPGADLLVVNKFGKAEAQGRGLCDAIIGAIDFGIPTLIGVNQRNIPDFEVFSAGLAVRLSPDIRAVRAWYETPEVPQGVTRHSKTASPRPARMSARQV